MLNCIKKEADCAYSSEKYIWYYRARADGCITLKIRRKDKAPINNWDDIYAIKNYTFGKEKIAIEIYPRASKLVNKCNMRHLFILTQEQIVGLNLERIL